MDVSLSIIINKTIHIRINLELINQLDLLVTHFCIITVSVMYTHFGKSPKYSYSNIDPALTVTI